MDNVIELVQDKDGVYKPKTKNIMRRKRVERQNQTTQTQFDELCEGVEMGMTAMKRLVRLFNVKN